VFISKSVFKETLSKVQSLLIGQASVSGGKSLDLPPSRVEANEDHINDLRM
jgi:hypothetical protein